MSILANTFGTLQALSPNHKHHSIYSLNKLEQDGVIRLSSLPFAIKVLLENLLRHEDGKIVSANHINALANWTSESSRSQEVPFMPARVLLQDFTGIPAIVDLAAMRSAISVMGGDPSLINPQIPVDLVIDHSVQVDHFGSSSAFSKNVDREYERNRERYIFMRWAQKAFRNFRVVPPDTGIVHQINLEYLADVVSVKAQGDIDVLFPDTVVGTDSHTTMINGLSVLGWGVGGIEAEAVLLGQPYYMLMPRVLGVKLSGRLPEGATSTDLVLTITNILRTKGVVGSFVEFFGPGLSNLALPDRATISNMAPEYGATVGFFPIDNATLNYLRLTGRKAEHIDLVESYAKAQGLFRDESAKDAIYSETIEIDISEIVPSLAGPKRPQDKVSLPEVKHSFQSAFDLEEQTSNQVVSNGHTSTLENGIIAIAAITSCTNTSNPSVMIGAGLLAKNAVQQGLSAKPWVKTSLAPGSRVVGQYLEKAGLVPFLEKAGFYSVGYGCTTCIGNSGPLPDQTAQEITNNDLVAVAVLSGNRNFEGRIHPQVKANYLASPMLVVAYALAGSINVDLTSEPIGMSDSGNPVYLKDIWPSQSDIQLTMDQCFNADMFQKGYKDITEGDAKWQSLPTPDGQLYQWDDNSTYVQKVPFFENMTEIPSPVNDIVNARVLVMLGDSITTDHISPAGSILSEGPAGLFLKSLNLSDKEFNTYGSRRGNHEVMVRGTFGNIRLKNLLLEGIEGDWTVYHPEQETMRIYDASLQYQANDIPLIILAGKEYGAGSSRDWAAKGPYLLGVKAVIAESYERIHRSNLIGMGILPLQFEQSTSAETLQLDGSEYYSIVNLSKELAPRQLIEVSATRPDGSVVKFKTVLRIDTPVEVEYYSNGGVLHTVLRALLKTSK